MREQYRALVIGVGGVGSWLSHGLARQMEYAAPGSGLILVDGDNFEAKNKERQAFKGMGNKAEVLASELAVEFQKTTILPLPKWVVEESVEEDESSEDGEEEDAGKISASDLLVDGDVVFAVVDNDACRKILIQAASKLDNVDLFTAGNDDAYYGSIYHYRRRNGVDITINPLENHPEYENPNDRNPGDLSCQERAELEGGTQLVATNMAVASFLLARNDKLILNENEITEAEIFFDLGVGLAQGYDRTTESVTTKETVGVN